MIATSFLVRLFMFAAVGTGKPPQAEPANGDAIARGERGSAAERSKDDSARGALKRGYYVFALLNEVHVQRELALTAAQKATTDGLARQFLAAMVANAKKTPVSPKTIAPGTRSDADRAKAVDDLWARFGDEGWTLLTDLQRKRLDQVIFQLNGVAMLSYPDVANALKLTEAQRDDLATIRTNVLDDARKLQERFKAKSLQMKGFDEAIDALLDNAKQRAVKALTPEQRKNLESMEGPKIGFARRDLDMTIRSKAKTKPPSATQ